MYKFHSSSKYRIYVRIIQVTLAWNWFRFQEIQKWSKICGWETRGLI